MHPLPKCIKLFGNFFDYRVSFYPLESVWQVSEFHLYKKPVKSSEVQFKNLEKSGIFSEDRLFFHPSFKCITLLRNFLVSGYDSSGGKMCEKF